MRKGAHGGTLVGSLIVVQRTVVEGLALARDELVSLNDVVDAGPADAKVGEAPLGNGR